MVAKAVNVGKELIVQKMSPSWHLEPVKNAATFSASHFFVLCFPMPPHFDLSKLPCVVLFVLMQHLLLCLAAYCISLNSITVSLLCIWTGATFWSVAPLMGWGSYTGLMPINTCYFCNISIIHHHLVLFLRPKIEVMARVRWTGPKPTTLPFTSPTSSPSSSSVFSSLWWSCFSHTSPS